MTAATAADTTATAADTTAISSVFIWDFDDTIIDGNSDLIPFAQLAPDIHATLRASTGSWTASMNAAFAALPPSIPPSDILASVAAIPIPVPILAALQLIHASPTALSCIVSDANSLFIDAILRAHGVSDIFDGGVFTNVASVVEGKIVVERYCKSKHGCGSCPVNLCKGEVVDGVVGRFPGAKFFYAGDGRNDVCGVRRVPAGGKAFPRGGFRLEKLLEREEVKADVRVWKDAEELLRNVQEVLR